MSRPSMLRRRAVPAVLVALAVLAGLPLIGAKPAAKPGQATVVPDRFLRRWDPVTVFFPQAVGPAKPGPEDKPERHVRLAPAHPGAWTWLDGRTLQFRPAEPWPPLQRFTVAAGGATTSLDTLMSPPLRTTPSEGEEVADPVRTVGLKLPEPLDPQTLARMLTIEVRPLPGVSRGAGAGQDAVRTLTSRDFTIKALDRKSRRDPAAYVVTLASPVPLGSHATLRFRLSLAESAPEASLDLSFRTAEPFRVTALGCQGPRLPVTPGGTRYGREEPLRCPAETPQVTVHFSGTPAALGPIAARNLVRFEPAVPGLTFDVSGSDLVVSGPFLRETLYKVTLAPGGASAIADQHRRPLDLRGPSEVYLVFPRRESYLRWGASQGIVERFGPRMAPVEGRGDERVDLRIYRIDPLNRSLWPFPDSAVQVDESQRPPGPGEEPKPWTEPERPVLTSELIRHLRSLGSPPVSTIVTLPLRREGSSARFGLDLGPHLDRLSGQSAPGTYLVGLRRLDRSSARSWIRLQATDLSLTAAEEPRRVVFGVTSLSTGKPVAGATVRVEGSQTVSGSGEGARWTTLFEGTTDVAGRLVWNPPGYRQGRAVEVRRIVVKSGDSLLQDTLVLDPARAPDGFADGQWSPSSETWLGWAFNDNLGARGPQAETLCHLFTERPVYRPEETVHVKGYLRRRERGQLTPERPAGKVVVQGPGDLIWRYPVEVTAAGSFYRAFSEQKLPTGVYSAWFEDSRENRYGTVSWKMEAYRLPRFQVLLHSADRVPLDKEFTVGLTATYYAGGRVAARPVAWRVTQFPYAWTPKRRSGFLYSSDGRFSRTDGFESSPRLEKQDTTDAEGGARLVLNPAIEPTAQPRTYVVEATVTGADDQTVTAVRQVVALPPFVLGLKVPRYLEKAASLKPELLVVGPDDKPIPGLEVKVRLLQRQWHSHLRASDFSDGVARYMTDVVDEKVSETKVKSGDGPVSVPLSLPRSGVYVVELEASDRLGRTQVVSVDLYAGGEQPVTWAKQPAGVFTVASDKAKYQPGETAKLVLQSPFQKGAALAVIEAPEGNRYEWVAVEGGAATFELPVQGTWTPRLPVHFVLMRGRVPGTAPQPGNATDLGKPATLATTTWLDIEPVDNRVDVKLTHAEKAKPGEKVQIQIDLRDPQGKPRPGEVTLWLVDQAVLALGREQRLDPLPDFITKVMTHWIVRDTRNLVFGFLPFAENPGGDGGAGEPGSLFDRATVRRNFKPVPYFNPAIQVGPDGTARVTVDLPDDLTVFKIRAKAASGPDRFGFGVSQIAVRLPVIIQPSLPRFVRPGDRFLAAGIGRIVEGEGGPGAAEVRAEGVKIEGPAKQSFTWSTAEPQRVEVPVTVPTPPYKEDGTLAYDKVTFRFGVQRTADNATDAFEVPLPVRDDRRPVKIRLMQDLAVGASLPLPALPEPARPGSVRRSILVSDQAALVRMAAGLDFLNEYPYGCTEQRLSRARAEIALRKLRDLLEQEGNDERIRRAVDDTLQWLPQTVDPNGLVAYWPGSRGYVSLTAWVVQFLVEAKTAGFRVDDALLDRLTRALQQSLRSDYGRFIDGEAYAERAWALIALAAAGKGDPAYAAELARRAQFLDAEGVAQVLQAFQKAGDTTSPATDVLARQLWDGLVFRLFQGKEIYGGLQKKVSARNALILPSETRTLSEVTRALARKEPTNPRFPRLIEALVTLGRDDGWGSTNANAAALLALSELLKAPYAGSTPHAVEVRFGSGAPKALALGPQAPVNAVIVTDGGAGNVVHRTGEKGPVLVRVETTYLPAGDGAQEAARANGFVVSREILRVRGENVPPERTPISEPAKKFAFQVGDVVEDHVRVVNPKDRTFVAVVVPLAAGMEPLNPSLATAPPEAKPEGRITLEPSYVAFLDDQVAFFYDTLPKGTYDFYFRTRAQIEGSYVQPAARAEMMYDLAVEGTSPGARIEVGGK